MDSLPPSDQFLYTPKEQKRLRKTLARLALAKPVGRAQCPYCMHIEARWRTVPASGDEHRVEVRVHCSQCQRRLTYDLQV